MLMTFEFFLQVTLTMEANLSVALLILAMSNMLEVLIFLMELVRSLMNIDSFSLSLMIKCLLEMMYSSVIGIMMVREAWLDKSLQSV